MARVNVVDEYGELVGWFDPDKAEKFKEDSFWNGNNWVSIATGSQWDHETLYRTAGGRWVLYHWSQFQGRRDWYEFISAERAREWLLKNNHDEAVERFFGEIEEERGPGRPEIGQPIQVRLPQEMLEQVDGYAAREKISRAEAIRRLLEAALARRV